MNAFMPEACSSSDNQAAKLHDFNCVTYISTFFCRVRFLLPAFNAMRPFRELMGDNDDCASMMYTHLAKRGGQGETPFFACGRFRVIFRTLNQYSAYKKG